MSIDAINESVWSSVEASLTPYGTEDGSNQIGVVHLIYASCLASIGCATAALAAVAKLCHVAYHYFQPQTLSGTFQDVCNDSRVWARYENVEEKLTEHPLGEGNPDFKYGVATCTYQDSGSVNCPDSQWPAWEVQKIANSADRSGKSANLFELYKTPEGRRTVINRLQHLGVTTYRFSVEWSHLQPQKDAAINAENLQVYIDLCKQLRDAEIEPFVTLHHFSEPAWFHQMGSFEKEENSNYFVNFADTVVSALTVSYNDQPLVEQFCTINEPAIEAFSRYVLGSFSCSPADPQGSATSLVGKIFELFTRYVLRRVTPGTLLNFNRAGHFLRGALKAHSVLYERLKNKNLPASVQIGIVHQYLQFIPTKSLLVPVTKYFTHLINEVTLHYFKTGEFSLKMPFCHISSQHKKPQTDFVGLQYYVRPVIGLAGPTSYHEPMTLMPFREDPEGLYEAIIKTYDHFQKPVMITESGISTKDEDQRCRYITRALFAAQQATDVIGVANLKAYYYWCFVRNLEWNMGMNSQDFGAYELLPDGAIDKQPKEGMKTFTKIAHAFKTWKETQQKQVA